MAASTAPPATSPPSITSVTFGTLAPPAAQAALIFGRRAWVFALVPVAAAGLLAAWCSRQREPVLATLPAAESTATAQTPAPVAAGSAEGAPASDAAPRPERDAGNPQPGAPSTGAEAAPGTAALPEARVTPVAYNMIVLHPRPSSAKGDAANARITALLQPLTAKLETQKQADAEGRLTVHYFHAEDAAAANNLANTVRTPGARVKVRGPIHTQKAWPSGSFELWLRGP